MTAQHSPTAFPLCWPPGWPVTEAAFRETSKFKTTLPGALTNLKRQIELMGGSQVLLSSNYTLGMENPKVPGVVAYFTWDKEGMSIPCDRWTRIEANIQAIALTVEAMRGMERWGAKHMIKALFTGFKRLAAKAGGIDPYEVLGLLRDVPLTEERISGAFRAKAKIYHTDIPVTGSAVKYSEIREAHDLLMQNVRK
jgi:hypothetical protein